jgi:hypothetical protein
MFVCVYSLPSREILFVAPSNVCPYGREGFVCVGRALRRFHLNFAVLYVSVGFFLPHIIRLMSMLGGKRW